MGSSQSKEKIDIFEHEYIKQARFGHPYFGNHTLLINRNKKQTLICKQMIFQSSAEYKQFLKEYEKVDKKPFNLIYPKMIIQKDYQLETCSTVQQVNVYLEIIGKNLSSIVKERGLFSENSAWFLLIEISKSLEILLESSRPHWALSPETIFQNCYQNYLIYDSLFILGLDPQSFLTKKVENKERTTQKMQLIMERGMQVSASEGYEQDSYCLGLVILFCLTGIHQNSLPLPHFQRSNAIKSILRQIRDVIGPEMIDIIQMLTEKQSTRRMDNYQLRRLLRDKQAEIIHYQYVDNQKSRRNFETGRQKIIQTKRKQIVEMNSQHQPIIYHSGQSNHYPNRYENQFPSSTRKSAIFNQEDNSMQYVEMKDKKILINQNKHTFPGQIQLSPVFDSSDRSKTLTRINSYDRLMYKK